MILAVTLLGSQPVRAAVGSIPLNSVSGSTTLSRTDLTVGKIFPIGITRTYHSKSGYAGPLGYGWALGYDKQLYTYPDNSVIIRTGPGQKKKYTASGSSYTSPVTDYGILTYDGTAKTYTYTTPDGTKELYDSYGRLASITDPKGASLAFSYVSASKFPLSGVLPTSLDQANPTVIAYAYHLSRIDEKNASGTATGKWVTFSYDAATGALTGLNDNLGRTISYGHDAIGNLTTVSGPGVVAAYGYTDANNKHLLTTIDEGRGAYTNSYDTLGRVARQVHGNTTMDVAYTVPGKSSTVTTTVRDASGAVLSTETRTVTLDSQRQVINETDTLGNQIKYIRNSQTQVTRKEWWKNTGTVSAPNLVLHHAIDYTYNAKGNTLTKIEMDGATAASSTYAYTTIYTYDAAGNMLTETNPLNQTTTYTYNAKNQILTITGPQGNVTNTYYDSGNLHTANVAGATTTYVYDDRGNPNTVTDARGKVTTNSYDANDNLASVTDPTNKTVSFTYDVNGNMLTQTDPAGKITTLGYDTMNRLVTIEDPLHHVTTYTYDANGNRDTVTDANHNTTTYTYNDEGQVATVTDALGKVTTYSYGGTGCPTCGGSGGSNLVGLTDAKGQATGWQYDFLKRMTQETDPLLKMTTYHYNSKGNLDYKIDANGNNIQYGYDSLKRLTGITYPDNTTVAYTYDAAGRVETATSSDVTYTYGYDAAGRTTSVSDSRGYTIAYEYDITGNRTKMTLQKNTADERMFNYAYDDAGRPTGITSAAGTFTYNYDSRGRRSDLTYPNQVTATYAYDDAGRLTGLSHAVSGGATIAAFAYTLDNVGNRLSKAATETEQYQYDAIYRLLAVTSSNPEAFSYDAVGNRLSGPTAGKDTAYLYNAGNQMTHGRKLAYNYDNNGNQTTRTLTPADGKSWTLTWDYENRLKSMVNVGGNETRTVSFKYDPFGRRIEKQLAVTLDGPPATTTTSTWKYVYDNDNIVMEILTDAGGATKTYYTHGVGTDEHLALERSGSYYYYHADGLGSVTTISDANKVVVQSYQYDSFGMVKPVNNNFRNSYTYTGREWDKETGLYYYRARYYDPMDGRFIQKDPISFAGGDTNLFAYTKNNPVTFSDPSGLLVENCDPKDCDKKAKEIYDDCMKKMDHVDTAKKMVCIGSGIGTFFITKNVAASVITTIGCFLIDWEDIAIEMGKGVCEIYRKKFYDLCKSSQK